MTNGSEKVQASSRSIVLVVLGLFGDYAGPEVRLWDCDLKAVGVIVRQERKLIRPRVSSHVAYVCELQAVEDDCLTGGENK